MGSYFRRFYGRVSDPGHWATFGGTLGIDDLPNLPWDFRRQNSRNFLSLHRITVSGLTRISSDL
jgi:hypothetical protein